MAEDVLDDVGRRGRRQGQHGRPAEPVDRLAQRQVLGAEVVAPLAHAMRLVDNEQVDHRGFQAVDELGVGQALGRRVDELLPPCLDCLLDLAKLGGRERAVDRRDLDPALVQGVGLVLHQGDQRTDDHRRPLQRQGGQLEAEALARAGRHDHQRVAPLQRRADGPLLTRPEPSEPEMFPQDPPELRPRLRRQLDHRPALSRSPPGREVRAVKSRRKHFPGRPDRERADWHFLEPCRLGRAPSRNHDETPL